MNKTTNLNEGFQPRGNTKDFGYQPEKRGYQPGGKNEVPFPKDMKPSIQDKK